MLNSSSCTYIRTPKQTCKNILLSKYFPFVYTNKLVMYILTCFAPGPDNCCNFYNDTTMCVDMCPTPFININSDNECVCPPGTTAFNCSERKS